MSGIDRRPYTRFSGMMAPFLAAISAVVVGAIVRGLGASKTASEVAAIATYVISTAGVVAFASRNAKEHPRSYFQGAAILFAFISVLFLSQSGASSPTAIVGDFTETVMGYIGVWTTSADAYLPIIFSLWAFTFVMFSMVGYLIGISLPVSERRDEPES